MTDVADANSMTARDLEKLHAFWRFAAGLSDLSTCRRRAVGCVVADPGLTSVLAIGYNGPPRGLPNDRCREAEGACGCIHAEANALVKLRGGGGLALLTTTSPCEHCAGLIVNCGKVATVIYGDAYRDSSGLAVLLAAGVAAVDVRTLLEELP